MQHTLYVRSSDGRCVSSTLHTWPPDDPDVSAHISQRWLMKELSRSRWTADSVSTTRLRLTTVVLLVATLVQPRRNDSQTVAYTNSFFLCSRRSLLYRCWPRSKEQETERKEIKRARERRAKLREDPCEIEMQESRICNSCSSTHNIAIVERVYSCGAACGGIQYGACYLPAEETTYYLSLNKHTKAIGKGFSRKQCYHILNVF